MDPPLPWNLRKGWHGRETALSYLRFTEPLDTETGSFFGAERRKTLCSYG